MSKNDNNDNEEQEITKNMSKLDFRPNADPYKGDYHNHTQGCHEKLAPITKTYKGKLKEMFQDVNEKFDKLLRMKDLGGLVEGMKQKSEEQEAETSQKVDQKLEEDFIDSLSLNDLKELIKTEILKRSHCKKKLALSQQQCLEHEEKLTLSETVCSRQHSLLQEVENMVHSFCEDFSAKEHEWIIEFKKLENENLNLLENFNLARSFSQTLSKQVEDIESAKASLHQNLETQKDREKSMKTRVDELVLQLESASKENSALKKEIDRMRKVEKEWLKKEDCLNSELLELENKYRKAVDENETLLQELASVQTLATEKVESIRIELEENKQREILEIHCSTSHTIETLTEKLKESERKKKEFQDRLTGIEFNLAEKQRTMCLELQQRLAGKYRELLCEFGQGTSNWTGRTPDLNTLNESLLELPGDDNNITNSLLNSTKISIAPPENTRKVQLNSILKQVLNSIDQDPNHPTDPPSSV